MTSQSTVPTIRLVTCFPILSYFLMLSDKNVLLIVSLYHVINTEVFYSADLLLSLFSLSVKNNRGPNQRPVKCPRSFPFSFHNTIPVLATQAPNTADSVSLVLCILSSPFSRLLSSYVIVRAFQLFFFHMLFLSRYSSPNRLSPSCY